MKPQDHGRRYFVLYTQTVKQEKLKTALEKAFPPDRGTILLPRMEWWRRGKNEIQLKALYPGYIFIHSDMDAVTMHEFIRSHHRDIRTYIRELGLSEKRARGEDFDDDVPELNDLTEVESCFLDCMLNADGIMEMSEGFAGEDGYTVMSGPLKAYEGQIVDVDNHNRMAYLDFQFRGHVAKAGMRLLPRKHWFPESDERKETLEDGTQVDLDQLRRMMEGQTVNSMPDTGFRS